MATKPKKTAAAPAAIAQPTPMLIPLEKLRLAPENARFGLTYDEAGLKALAASLADPVTRQLTPLNAYPEGDLFMVWDGGRRLSALQLLAGGEGLALSEPAHLVEGVQVQVDADRGAARLRSAATFVREDLHPAQEFLIYKGLLDDGHSIDQIAAACAVTKPRVRQLLRLIGVCPEIIDAFKAGLMALDAVEAFTITDDLARQWEAYLALADKNKLDAWSIKAALKSDSLPATSMWAKLVGRDAYEASGGTFFVDLFSNDGDEDWADKALAMRLAEEIIEAELAKLRADGWVNAVFSRYEDYYFDSRLARVYPNSKDGEQAYSDGIKANGTAFLKQKHDGTLSLQVYTRPSTNKVAADAPQKADPSAFGWGHGGHYKMTHVATEAVRVGLMNNPAAAYDAVVAHTAWTVLRRDHSLTESTASTLRPERLTRFVSVVGTDTFTAAVKRWSATLPVRRVAFNVAVADLSAEDKAELLALCFAASLDASEGRFDQRKPQRWSDLGWMAKHSGTDVGAAWRPDEDFIKGGSKDAICEGLKEAGSQGHNDVKQKKSDLAKDLFKFGATNGWTPRLLAGLANVAPEPDEAEAAARRLAARSEALEAIREAEPAMVDQVIEDHADEDDIDFTGSEDDEA